MSWQSNYICDWCGLYSEPNIRDDSFIADGWREFDGEHLCKDCVGYRAEGLANLKQARRYPHQSGTTGAGKVGAVTVAELIEKLKTMPPDAVVWMSYWTGMASDTPVGVVRLDAEGTVTLGETEEP